MAAAAIGANVVSTLDRCCTNVTGNNSPLQAPQHSKNGAAALLQWFRRIPDREHHLETPHVDVGLEQPRKCRAVHLLPRDSHFDYNRAGKDIQGNVGFAQPCRIMLRILGKVLNHFQPNSGHHRGGQRFYSSDHGKVCHARCTDDDCGSGL